MMTLRQKEIQNMVSKGLFQMSRDWDTYQKLFAELVINETDRVILDSGCGLGYACQTIKRLHPNMNVTGITMTSAENIKYPVIFHNMENELPSDLNQINICIDVYGAIAYSCYPVRVIGNILDKMAFGGKIYIYCTFMGRLLDVRDILQQEEDAVSIISGDDCYLILKKENITLTEKSRNEAFYPVSFRINTD